MSPLEILESKNRMLRAELNKAKNDLNEANIIHLHEAQSYRSTIVFYVIVIFVQFACLIGLLF